METRHQIDDPAKVAFIARSLRMEGWVGSPLVRWGDVLITGVHRYAAAQQVGMTDADLPLVDLEQIFAAAGMDFAALHAEYGSPTIDEASEIEALLAALPENLRNEYGIEC